MFAGIIAGITWAIATVVLNSALGMQPLQAMALATFISTFLHDASSAIFATLYNGIRGNLGNVWKALKTKSGKWVILAAVIGGPVGMTGYVMSINYMGASIGAVASAVFPAIGAVLAFFFLKEKMKWYQWLFLLVTLGGVYGLSLATGDAGGVNITNFWLGLLGTAMCAFGWGIEAVILAKCLKDPEVTDEYALQIRQTTSAVVYAAIILPILGGWVDTTKIFNSSLMPIESGTYLNVLLPVIVIAGLFATISYLYYYKAIAKIGASKAMALNITYCAWAIFFAWLFTGDTSALSFWTILCTVVILVCGIFAATDFKELFKKNN